MSQIEFDCPYCNNKQFIEVEGMTDWDNWENNCIKCHKNFIYRIAYLIEGYTDKKLEAKK